MDHKIEYVSKLTDNVVSTFGKRRMGIPTGIRGVDVLLNGLEPGDFVICAGRPGLGKSAYAGTIALAASQQYLTLFVSLEMTKDRLIERMLSSLAKVNCRNMVQDKLSAEDKRLVEAAKRELDRRKLLIDDDPRLHPVILRKKLEAVPGIRLVIIDYLQLMHGDENRSREQEVARISRDLKLLAHEFKISIIALCQLNRMVEQRDTNLPRMSDLRESGALEQDADKVLLLHRPSYYDIQSAHTSECDDGQAKIIVAKNRNGPVDIVDCAFIAEYVSFYDLEKDDF